MENTRAWRIAAKRLARRLNLGTWLSRTLPLCAGASFVAACLLLLLRRRGVMDLTSFWLATIGVLTLLALLQFLRARSSRLSVEGALVWLEHELRLNNRLTAASAGVGDWPRMDLKAGALLRWRPSRIAPAVFFSVAFLVTAAFIPVTIPPEPVPPPIEQPIAWTDVERWLEELKETELVEEEAIDAWEEKLESLQNQPQEDWYQHGSLEAGDSLRDALESDLLDLERGLSSAEASLGEMLELAENSSAADRRLAERGLSKAMEELDLESLPLSREMKRRLETLARERKVRKLSKEELEKLRERLRERRYHDLPRPGDEAYAFAVPGAGEPGPGQSGTPGRGGVTRGPGTAPIELADERTELGTSSVEDVMGHKPLGIEFGETVGIGIGEHDTDTDRYRGGYEAGTVSSTGEGGDVVWSQTLTPEERRVLKKYFQ